MVATVNASTSAGVVITPDNSGVLALQSSSATALTIDASQNVGIGTTSPTGRLHVSAPASTQYGTFDAVTATSAFTNYKVGGTVYGYLGDASGLVTGGTAGDLALRFSGAMVFSGGANERMRIDSSGNVMTGLTSALGNFSINITPSAPATSGSMSKGLTVTNTSGGRALNFGVNESGGYTYIQSAYVNSADNAQPMAFFTGPTERMRIDSSGNVFMSDTTLYPGDGNTATGLMFQASAGKLFVSASGGNTAFSYNLNGTGTIGYFCSSGTRVGNIGVTGSTTSYNSGSDYRLKNNVQPLTNALSKVALLKPSSWIWKTDNSYGDGFIAHELAEICPQAVNGTKDAVDAEGNPVYQGVDTSFLVATLTAAIQELKAINDTLTARIVALENR